MVQHCTPKQPIIEPSNPFSPYSYSSVQHQHAQTLRKNRRWWWSQRRKETNIEESHNEIVQNAKPSIEVITTTTTTPHNVIVSQKEKFLNIASSKLQLHHHQYYPHDGDMFTAASDLDRFINNNDRIWFTIRSITVLTVLLLIAIRYVLHFGKLTN